jgi:hypothetical protein
MSSNHTPQAGGGIIVASRQPSEFLEGRTESVLLPGEIRVPADLHRPTPVDWTRLESVNLAPGTPLGAHAIDGSGTGASHSTSKQHSLLLEVGGQGDDDAGYDWASKHDSLQWASPNGVAGADAADASKRPAPAGESAAAAPAAAPGLGGAVGPLLHTPHQSGLDWPQSLSAVVANGAAKPASAAPVVAAAGSGAPPAPGGPAVAAGAPVASAPVAVQQQQVGAPVAAAQLPPPQRPHQYAQDATGGYQQPYGDNMSGGYGYGNDHHLQHHGAMQPSHVAHHLFQRRSAAQMMNEELLRQSRLFPPPPPPPTTLLASVSDYALAAARFELWHHHAAQWDITHTTPPPPRNPRDNPHGVSALANRAFVPYSAEAWMERCASWGDHVLRTFAFPVREPPTVALCATEQTIAENAIVA